MNPFSRYIRIRRERAGLSLRAVARAVGIGHVYLGEVERGERPPLGRRHWERLAEVVPGIRVEALEWAAASAGPVTVNLSTLSPRLRFAALAAHRGNLGDEPMEHQEDALDRLRAQDNPGLLAALRDVVGKDHLTAEEIVDTLVALGWMPNASDLIAHLDYLLHQHQASFVKVGRQYRRR